MTNITHPVTNLPMLDESNYRSWELMIRRQFEAQDLLEFITNPNPTTGLYVQRHARAINIINEHCSNEIRTDYFGVANTEPTQ